LFTEENFDANADMENCLVSSLRYLGCDEVELMKIRMCLPNGNYFARKCLEEACCILQKSITLHYSAKNNKNKAKGLWGEMD